MEIQIELKNGYFQTNQPIEKNPFEKTFVDFIRKDKIYKKRFLQENYNYGFDGYSYLGQKDSTNQYPQDKLHLFVLSEFHAIESYPEEFHNYMNFNFKNNIETVKCIEKKLLETLPLNNKKVSL